MRRGGRTSLAGAALFVSLGLGGARADEVLLKNDPVGDAVARRTDSDADAPLASGHVLPDLTSARLRGLFVGTSLPAGGPGEEDKSGPPDILEIRLIFSGLVNPPGPLGFAGLGYDANRYGPSPLYGFLDIDVDDDRDTGGELTGPARRRYMANVGRFGKLPHGSASERAVKRPLDLDSDFFTEPYFERSGAEFTLALCACSPVTVVTESGDMDGEFDPGEQWVIKGRFFKRAEAYQDISSIGSSGLGGPSEPGLYDPEVLLTFTHDDWNDQTTVEMSFPLTPEGAAALLGGEVVPFDFAFGGTNPYSLGEALFDLIVGASDPPLGVGQDVLTLAGAWGEQDPFLGPFEHLNPEGWCISALFGTASSVPENDPFIWTDTGFGEVFGDVNGDQVQSCSDATLIRTEIDSPVFGDGSPEDAGPDDDGRVTIADFGPEFSVFDVLYDGEVGPEDLDTLNPCPVDLAEPFCVLDFSDVFAFLSNFVTCEPCVDLAEPFGVCDYSDVLAFLIAFGQGCTP